MRFPIAALFFLVASFIFFVIFTASSLLISNVSDAMDDYTSGLDSRYADELSVINTAFGIISAIFFVTGIVLLFVLDSLSEDPELYYRR